MLLLAADDVNAETMVIRSSRIVCNTFVFFFFFFSYRSSCRLYMEASVCSRYTGIVIAIRSKLTIYIIQEIDEVGIEMYNSVN